MVIACEHHRVASPIVGGGPAHGWKRHMSCRPAICIPEVHELLFQLPLVFHPRPWPLLGQQVRAKQTPHNLVDIGFRMQRCSESVAAPCRTGVATPCRASESRGCALEFDIVSEACATKRVRTGDYCSVLNSHRAEHTTSQQAWFRLAHHANFVVVKAAGSHPVRSQQSIRGRRLVILVRSQQSIRRQRTSPGC